MAVVVAAAFVLRADDEGRLVPGGGTGSGEYDPLAYSDERRDEFERRAASGLSHVLYAKSPGGITASAERTARWRPEIEAAAGAGEVDADMLEAIVLLESAGRPDAIAGDDPEAAAGLAQILAGTAVDFLGMDVDLAASRRITRRIARAEREGETARVDRLRAQRRRVDERFVPAAALAGAVRYLTQARERLGGDDLAVVSYHMGIGNLEGVIAGFGEGDDVSYARLYFDSSPINHEDAWRRLSALGDDSATYLWRVLAAREIMRLHREDPAELERRARLHGEKASAEEVLHPREATDVFEAPDEVERARDRGDLVALPEPDPDDETPEFAIDRRMGELAPRLGRLPDLYRALRPEALAVIRYIAAGVREVDGEEPLVITSTVRDREYQRLLRRRNREATGDYSLHTTGFAFDVSRRYASRDQARAFQFMLDRLQALDLIAWVREPGAIHVTASGDARELLKPLVDDE